MPVSPHFMQFIFFNSLSGSCLQVEPADFVLQIQQRRIRELEHQLQSSQSEASRKDDQFQVELLKNQEVDGRIRDLQQELENSAAVVQLHTQELLRKNEELLQLRTIIDGLGGPRL